MHCETHPAYKGDREIKRLEKCEGCRKVRQAWLAGFEKRKNKGKGSQFSITTPGFRCGIIHLMAEVGTILLYGKQPPFFWRKNTKADPRAKAHYSKIYNLLNIRFQSDPSLPKALSQILWLVWENDFHKISREKEREQSMQLSLGESQPAQVEKPEKIGEHLGNVHINPLLFGDIIEDGEEEEENRSF